MTGRSVTVHVSDVTLRSLLLLINAQSVWATANLGTIALALHLALGFRNGLAAHKFVAAEALTAELSSCERETARGAVGNALGVGDLLVADVGELDGGEDTCGCFVGEAALVGVAGDGTGCWGWESDSCVDDIGLGDDRGDDDAAVVVAIGWCGLCGDGLGGDGLESCAWSSRGGDGCCCSPGGGNNGGSFGGDGLSDWLGGCWKSGSGFGGGWRSVWVVGWGRGCWSDWSDRKLLTPFEDRVGTWKGIHDTSDSLRDKVGNSAVLDIVQATWDVWALVHTSGSSIAGINDGLESLLVPAVDEITVQAVTGLVTVGENPRRVSLSWSPAAFELEGIPVDLEEEMRNTDETCWASVAAGESHVVLIVTDTLGWVVARWEVDISSERRGITIALNVWESNTLTINIGILHTNTVHAIGSGRIDLAFGGTRAGPLNWLRSTSGRVEDVASRLRWSTSIWLTNEHTETLRESMDLLVVILEAVTC